MRDDDAMERVAREVLPLLPALLGADAPAASAGIGRALAAAPGAPRRNALVRALSADPRVRDWVTRHLDGGNERGAPGGTGFEPLAGDPAGIADAVRFECRTANCPSPGTWWRSYLGEETPRCRGCSRLLSRAEG